MLSVAIPRGPTDPQVLNGSHHEEQQDGREPNPSDFTHQDLNGLAIDEFTDADGRDGDRSHWEEIPAGVERREEGHTESAVCPCIQHTM